MVVPPGAGRASSFGLKAHAVAVVFTPEETTWAGLRLAAAHAFLLVKDLIVTANMGSADTFSHSVVPEVWVAIYVWADMRKSLACAIFEAPELSIIITVVWGASAFAIVGIKEFSCVARLLVADASVGNKVPVLVGKTVFGIRFTLAGAILINVPEVAFSASLRFFFTSAVDSVEVPSMAAEVTRAASALTRVEVPSLVILARFGCARAFALAGVPESSFFAMPNSRLEADALAGVR